MPVYNVVFQQWEGACRCIFKILGISMYINVKIAEPHKPGLSINYGATARTLWRRRRLCCGWSGGGAKNNLSKYLH